MLYWGQIHVNISHNRHVFGTIKSFHVDSSTFYVYSDITFSPAHVISWLHRALPSTYRNILNAACGICASRITELFPYQYGLFHLPRVLADGNSRYLLPKGCYWQMCHTHYPFDPPFWLLSGNIWTFPIGRIQDNHISPRLNAAMVSSIVLANSACFTFVKELLYAAMMRLLRIYPAVLFKALTLLVKILYTTICAYAPLP